VSKAIEDKAEVSKDDVEKLIDSDEVDDDAVMVPCDMSEAADVEDIDNLLETMGASKVAEIFVKARKKFQDNLQSMPEADRDKMPQQMTGAEYKQMMEEEMDAYAEALGMECGESELEEEDEEVAEPPSKKAKSS